MMAEGIRRSVWAVLRVENEQSNNFEQYRLIDVLPPIRDEEEDKN